jgi:hypothetical protein
MCSDDDGKTWSEPQKISTAETENMTTNDRLVRLRTGRVLLPASGVRNPVWISDDDGATWRNGEGEYQSGAGEPTVVELADGTLKVYSRQGSRSPVRHFDVAFSRDRGEHWERAPETPLCSAAVPCLVRRLPGSDDLLMVWNNHDHRSNLTAALSHDGGVTWENYRLLEPQASWPLISSCVYPSLNFSGGYAHITYWESHRHPKADYLLHLIYRRLPIPWFYEKRPPRALARIEECFE